MAKPVGDSREAAAAALVADRPPQIGLAAIFLAFLKLGSTAFGGGTAGWLYRDIVVRRAWVSNERFLTMLAVGQALPGANGLKATVLVGQYLHGPFGSAAALAGFLAGPFVIILAIAGIYSGVGDHPAVHAVLDGMAAGAIGLTFDTGLRSVTQGPVSPASLAIAAATVLCVGI